MGKAKKPKPGAGKAAKAVRRKRPRGIHKTRKPPLSEQDIKFCHLLLARHAHSPKKTVPQCYLEAGFPAKGTPHSTEIAAHRAMRNRGFRDYYRQRQDHLARAAMVSPEMLLAADCRIITANRLAIFDEAGNLLPPNRWPKELEGCIESVETETVVEIVKTAGGEEIRQKVYVRKVKFSSRIQAIGQAMAALGMTRNDAAQQGPPPGCGVTTNANVGAIVPEESL